MLAAARMGPVLPFLVPIVAAQIAAAPPADTARNVPPEWTEHPTVTFVTDDPKATLQKVDMTPSEHARHTWSKQGGLAILLADSQTVCVAPCEKRLPNVDLYTVTGPGITRSSFFVLPRSEKVTITAKTGSSTLTAIGATAVVIGGLALIPGAALSLGYETRGVGLAILGGSITFLAGGIYALWRGMTVVDMKKPETAESGR